MHETKVHSVGDLNPSLDKDFGFSYHKNKEKLGFKTRTKNHLLLSFLKHQNEKKII